MTRAGVGTPTGERLVSGGWYITLPFARPPGLGDELLAEQLCSLSTCFAPHFPSVWALAWGSDTHEERVQAAAAFGIGAARVDEVVDYVTKAFDTETLGWTTSWQARQHACDAARVFGLTGQSQHESAAPQPWLIELALRSSDADALRKALAPQGNQGPSGLFLAITADHDATDGGEDLGWEVLSAEGGCDFHSWLCNGLHHDAKERWGLTPGRHGLLLRDDAVRVASNVDAHAEPGPWIAGRLTRHPLS